MKKALKKVDGKKLVRMQLKDFTGKACKSSAAFEFIPRKKLNLSLGEVAVKIKSKGGRVEAETPFLLMLNVQEKSVSFFRSGKIIVKDTKSEQESRKIAEKVAEYIKP